MRRPIVLVTVLVVSGILLGELTSPGFAAVAGIVLVGLIAFPAGRIRGISALEYVGVSALLLSVGMLLQMRGAMPELEGLPKRWEGKVTGVVAEEPEIRRVVRASGLEEVETEEEQSRFLIRLLDAKRRATHWRASVLVPGRVEVKYGELLELRGSLFLFPEDRNPGQFDYREYLLRRRIIAGISVPTEEAIIRLDEPKGGSLKRALVRMKSALRRNLSRGLDEDGEQIMGAMVLGDRQRVRGKVEDDFVKSGTAHILTVSGFHIGVAAFFAWAAVRLLGGGITLQAVVACLASVGYAGLTGFAPASLRATAMICCWQGAVIFRRQADGLSTLGLALLVVLGVLGGEELFSPGLQLSFAAVSAIVLLSPRLERLLGGGRKEPWEMLLPKSGWQQAGGWIGNIVRKLVAIGTSAWIGTAPILAYHFHIATPSALLGNLAVVPLASVLIPLGLLGGAVGWMPVVGVVVSGAIRPLLWLLRNVVWLLAELPGGHFYTAGPSAFWVLFFFGMLGVGLWRRKLGIGGGRFAAVVLLAASVYAWQGAFTRQRERLELTVLDVGRGLASCVFLPEGPVMVFDAGSMSMPGVGKRVVAPFLWERGARKVDLLLISHTHSDHSNGVLDLLERMAVREVGVPVGFERSETGRALLRKLRERGLAPSFLGEGDVIGLGEAELRVMNPPKDPKLIALLDENERSLVVSLDHPMGRVLFTADAANFAVHRLSKRPPAEGWDVAVLPHHGLNPERAKELVDAARPWLALASYDERPTVLNELDVSAMDTASSGAISVRASPKGLEASGYLDAK